MTKLLESVLNEAAKLPPEDQDALARFLLDEIGAEHRWSALLSENRRKLETLADEALNEFREGKAVPAAR